MKCSQTTWLSNAEYLQEFQKKIAQQRIPLSGSLDLTHRCNLRCVHCYLSPNNNAREELRTEQWHAILDEITAAGCLNLLITGGEPLVRKDFAELYSHAKTNGMLVTVFTNGTLITERILELFQELPPYEVEISLYGATAVTYETITGFKGSYQRCIQGIQHLLDRQINLRLKTILMTLNRHEFDAIGNMAKAYGVKFRFDAAIFPCMNGDPRPLGLRVPPEEVVDKEFSDLKRVGEWQDFFDKFQHVPVTDDLYQCGAGRIMFHIDSYGNLSPCVMVNTIKYDLRNGSFLTGWNEIIPRIRKKTVTTSAVCGQCEQKLFCGYCPGFFALENGAENVHSSYLCAIGQGRFQRMRQNSYTRGSLCN